jgi:translation initiation factor 2-alpha kinase 4
MSHSGGIVTIPYDLRVPFARYVAWNGITCLKRYAIDRVYREKRVFGFHPRELYECAFDIVTPNTGMCRVCHGQFVRPDIIVEWLTFLLHI